MNVEEAFATGDGGHKSEADQDDRADGRGWKELDPIDFGRRNQLHHPQRFEPASSFADIEHRAGTKDGSVHARQDAEDQRDAETFDLISADEVEHERGKE